MLSVFKLFAARNALTLNAMLRGNLREVIAGFHCVNLLPATLAVSADGAPTGRWRRRGGWRRDVDLLADLQLASPQCLGSRR